jgi:phosphatidylglycerophosphate synthase
MAIAAGNRRLHPFPRFGAANSTTSVRALLVALVAAFVGEPATAANATAVVTLGIAVVGLDGVDGWLARRARAASAFGARFDMEIDAALILALSILTWTFGKAGPWVLASGLMRYGFVAAGWRWQWLRAPLAPSVRRSAVCAAQIVALLLAVTPAVSPTIAAACAAVGLAALSYSFFVDVLWLWNPEASPTPYVALAAAIFVLNVSLTFTNIWPTPAVWWQGELSIELGACILAMAALAAWRKPLSRRAVAVLSVLWTALVLGRYAEVTAPALYGRDINLYFDLQYIPDVVAMVTRVTPLWAIVVSVTAIALTLLLLYRAARWALNALNGSVARTVERRALVAVSAAAVALFTVDRVQQHGRQAWVFQHTAYEDGAGRLFSPPVTATYARQARLAAAAVWPASALPATPPLDSDLSRLGDADVFVVFIESYGAAAFERPEIAQPLAASRERLASAIDATGRRVLSAYVESPTYGGSSWLAHLSLLSGVEVRDPDTHARLMTEPRDTLVRAFRRRGYRTVALMPGMRGPWPEGAFYGFDEIYGADRLAYTGPEFGWFAVPDQFSLHRLDALEAGGARRAPLFVFFPTISPHFPFNPTPPYQADWARLSTAKPYDGPDLVRAYAHEPDWIHFAPGYVEAMAYDLASIGGYLRVHAQRDLVMILLGDHQPPALVSGAGAAWDVPVHIITNSTAIADRLRDAGFRAGLTPSRPAIGRMHALGPLVLEAFGERRGHPLTDVVRSQTTP